MRQLRRAKDMTQEVLADKCDIDRTYISGIERGIRNPSLDAIEAVAKALGVPVRDLFG